MPKLKNTLKNSILGGIFFSFTVLLCFLTYAAVSYQPWTVDIGNGESLTSTLWNKMQDNQTSLKAEIDGLSGSAGGGMKNLIINGAKRVNQRGASSLTQTSNAYNYDRWYYNGSSIIQYVEALNVIKSGTYTLSWEGSATAQVNGVGVSNGGQVSLTANTQTEVKFSNSNFNYVQLEYGSSATSFEMRPIGLELSLAKRYYQNISMVSRNDFYYTGAWGRSDATIDLSVEMRVAPSCSWGFTSITNIQPGGGTGTPSSIGTFTNHIAPRVNHSSNPGYQEWTINSVTGGNAEKVIYCHSEIYP